MVRQAAQYWEPVSVHHSYPTVSTGQKVIKGRAEYFNRSSWQTRKDLAEPVRSIHVKYGIENYFVPEGEGRDLERAKPSETVSIRIVVDKYGNAAIKAVLMNGAERYVERLL